MSAAAQAGFAAALRDPSSPAPDALAHASGGRPDTRFAVYRNNVAVALIGAIETRFPAVRRIVGDDFFRELARAFVMGHPPRSPVMMTYGDDFAGFIETAPGLGELPYLADVARLEAARTRAYHAADAPPLGAGDFATLSPDVLDAVTIALHPAVEVVRSSHPVVTIWAMNSGEAPLGPIQDWRAEDAVVSRPDLAVLVGRAPPGGAAFLEALARGSPLGEAAAEGAASSGRFDLTENFTGLISGGLAAGVAIGGRTRGHTP